MRRKLVATLLVGAIAVTGAIGFTACNKDDDKLNKGVEVTAEEWTKAFDNASKATNYTAKMYLEETEKGSVKVNGETKEFSAESSQDGTIYYDVANKKYYSDAHIKTVDKGYAEAYPGSGDEDETNDYDAKSYFVEESGTVYCVVYDGEEENAKWEVEARGYFPNSMLSYYLSTEYSTEKGGEDKSISDLYTSFTYSGGYYTATLYDYEDTYTVTIAIKDGYVVGYQVEGTATYTDDEETETSTEKTVINLSKIGSTTVEAPKEAVDALTAYKAK